MFKGFKTFHELTILGKIIMVPSDISNIFKYRRNLYFLIVHVVYKYLKNDQLLLFKEAYSFT